MRDNKKGEAETVTAACAYCGTRSSVPLKTPRDGEALNCPMCGAPLPYPKPKYEEYKWPCPYCGFENTLGRRAKSGEYPAVNRELTTLKHFFNFAIQREIIEKNPAVGVKKFPEKRRPTRLLSERELAAYFDYCRKNDPLLYDLSVIAYHTGLRRGDIVKIKGEDVDVERRTLTVAVSKRRGELTLTLPLNDTVLEVLARRSNDNGNAYLFPGRNVDHVVDFKRRFERAKNAVGVDFKFMEFRHNCATALLQSGVDIYTVKEILGHTSLTTTERYLKLVDERKRAALNKLDRKG